MRTNQQWDGLGEVGVKDLLTDGVTYENAESIIVLDEASGTVAWVDIPTGVIYVANVDGSNLRTYRSEATGEVGGIVRLSKHRLLAFARHGVFFVDLIGGVFSLFVGPDAESFPFDPEFARFNDTHGRPINGRFVLVTTNYDDRRPQAGAYVFDMDTQRFTVVKDDMKNGNGYAVADEMVDGKHRVVFCNTAKREAVTYQILLDPETGEFTEPEVFYTGPTDADDRQDGQTFVKTPAGDVLLSALFGTDELDCFIPGQPRKRLKIGVADPTNVEAVETAEGKRVLVVTTTKRVLVVSGEGVDNLLGVAA